MLTVLKKTWFDTFVMTLHALLVSLLPWVSNPELYVGVPVADTLFHSFKSPNKLTP